MKENGKMEKNMVKELFGLHMEENILDNGYKEKKVEMEC
jgi:hypothetical protein